MTDEYTREHMAGGRVAVLDKRVMGRGVQSMMLVPMGIFSLAALGGAVALALGVGPLGWLGLGVGGGMAAMSAFLWLTGSVLRTVVTDRELHVSAGLASKRIPLGRIKSVRIGEQRSRIKIGKRWEDGMWTDSYLTAFGEYVEVIWTDPAGKSRRLLFSPQDARAVLAALPGHEGVRVAAEPTVPEAVEVEAARPRDTRSE